MARPKSGRQPNSKYQYLQIRVKQSGKDSLVQFLKERDWEMSDYVRRLIEMATKIEGTTVELG